ncbi:MAG: dihydrofolate reductase [Muribaculaceae bacterium]|nr:dihydrofolate reductase [Muribaculaceae bacterium]
MEVNMIVAVGKDGAIGKGGDLIWRISEDLKRFKRLTMGHPVIMGRKTWESLPKRPLPGRRNIVISRMPEYAAEGGEVFLTPEESLRNSLNDSPFIMGGAQIYNLFLPLADRIYLTEIDAECEDADARLLLSEVEWQRVEEGEWNVTPEGVRYRYVELVRK